MKRFLLALGFGLWAMGICAAETFTLQSPNKKLSVSYAEGSFSVVYNQDTKVMTLYDFVLELLKVGKTRTVKTKYNMLTGKRSHCENQANEITLKCRHQDGSEYNVVFRAYNNGIAFRTSNTDVPKMKVECVNKWLMKYSDGYEDFYPINPQENAGKRWGFPCLFEIKDKAVFMLMSEGGIEKGNSGSCLYSENEKNLFRIGHDKDENPVTAWRVAMIGSLADVVESTLITDVSAENSLKDISWIKPGVVSWVYWAYNHGSNDYNIIKMYVDMARELKLPYVLIDAEWDEMKDGKTMEDAVKYALSQGIKPLIWYNSSVGWVNGAPGPKYRLNKPEDREKEFAYIESIGVAGVKVDFFAGDIQSTIDYHIDLMECAARHHLLINFHGATIPRGWQRTYPNLMTTEAVYGAEWYNNLPVLTKKAACHNATIPFTRGVIGSMDYTPCTFSDSQHPHITTDGHELALTVLYESGLLHLADRPSSYLSQPQHIKDFLSNLPSTWDETRLISGYPGESIVMARKKGDTWYVAGINGKDEPQDLVLKSAMFPTLQPVHVNARGGFVATFKDNVFRFVIQD